MEVEILNTLPMVTQCFRLNVCVSPTPPKKIPMLKLQPQCDGILGVETLGGNLVWMRS